MVRPVRQVARNRHLALLAMALLAVGCGGGEQADAPAPQAEQPGMLRRVHSADELESALKAAVRAAPAADLLASAVAAPAAAYSGTYTLEARVDELDTVKYDGSLLVVAPARFLSCCFIADPMPGTTQPAGEAGSRAIRILRTDSAAAKATEAGRIALEQGTSVQGLYLAGNRLVVLTSEAYFGTYGQFWTALPHWAPQRHGLRIYDIGDPAAPRAVFSAVIDGAFVDSRRVGDNLYVVSRHAPRVLLDGPSRATADSAALAALLPQVTVDGASRPLVDPLRCYVTHDDSDGPSAVLTSITVFPLGAPAGFVTTCYNEEAYGAYVTEQSLYLAQYRAITSMPGGNPSLRTRLHRFALASGAPAYRGSAEVEGALWLGGQADFRISESGGLLRVLTSSFTNDPADSVDHHLFVLRQSTVAAELELVGQLPNSRRPEEIGKPSEALYGVRFLGSRAFAATFQRIDPLYAFDLSDPADPRIAGSLELPGFSDLLHAVTDNLLLGIGQADGGGVRVALFDVTRLDQPRELGGLTYGTQGTSSEARTDRHAFAYLQDARPGIDHIAVPVNLYSSDGQYRFQESSLRLLEIHGKAQPAGASLVEAGRIVARVAAGSQPVHPVTRSRAFLHPASVFYVADEAVLAAQWARPDQVNGPF